MISPYKHELKKYAPEEGNPPSSMIVTIQRANQDPVTGKVAEMDDYGVAIVSDHPTDAEYLERTFVAFEDIRGVKTDVLNHDIVG